MDEITNTCHSGKNKPESIEDLVSYTIERAIVKIAARIINEDRKDKDIIEEWSIGLGKAIYLDGIDYDTSLLSECILYKMMGNSLVNVGKAFEDLVTDLASSYLRMASSKLSIILSKGEL